MENLFDNLVAEVYLAIQSGASVATVHCEGVYYTFTNLPARQTSGTITQQASYARQQAKQVVLSQSTVRPEALITSL